MHLQLKWNSKYPSFLLLLVFAYTDCIGKWRRNEWLEFVCKNACSANMKINLFSYQINWNEEFHFKLTFHGKFFFLCVCISLIILLHCGEMGHQISVIFIIFISSELAKFQYEKKVQTSRCKILAQYNCVIFA